MASKQEFCLRAFSECPTQHELLMKDGEDPRDYTSRMVEFWKKRFTTFGTAYLLPHHFLDMSPLLFYTSGLQEYPFTLQDEFIRYSKGLRMGYMSKDTSTVSELFPAVNDVPGDFSVAYNADVAGRNLKNLTAFSLADAAISIAILTGKSDITIGTDHRYDPVCYMVGVFGGGRHCLAASIDNFQSASSNKQRGDVEKIHQMIEIIQSEKMLSSGMQIQHDETMMGAQIRMSKVAALGKSGHTLLTKMWEIEEKKEKEELEKLLRKYKTTAAKNSSA
jgi:hypothetical protein